VKRGHARAVQYLIQKKFPLNKVKKNGISAVGIAAHKGAFQILKLLVEAGADVNGFNEQGVGPLYLAIRSQKRECIDFLIEAGARAYVEGWELIDNSPMFYAIRQNDVATIDNLAKHGADCENILSSAQLPPLNYAASCNSPEAVRVLVGYSKQVDKVDYNGHTCFTRALLQMRNLNIAALLLQKGADLNNRHLNKQNQTPLIMALQEKDTQAV